MSFIIPGRRLTANQKNNEQKKNKTKNDGLGVYRNMTCRSEKDAAQETDMTVEEFNEMRSEYANNSVEIEFLPLKDFKKQGFKGLMRQYLSAGR